MKTEGVAGAGRCAPSSEVYMLNAGDHGLLRSLETLSPTATGSSIAAHVDHAIRQINPSLRGPVESPQSCHA
jgi:hypothetical protein